VTFPRIGGPGAPLDLSNLNFNEITLQAGQVWTIPSGQYQLTLGQYSQLQTKDPITGLWRTNANAQNASVVLGSDGENWRLANLTGCPVAALVTNQGGNYTSAPTVTPSGGGGGSTWTAIVGGAVESITVGNLSSGYVYPPIVVIGAPPAGGVQATATIAINGNGTLGSVTMVNNGAGYTTAPPVTFVNDRRDTTGTPGATKSTATLGQSGNVTAVICTNHGLPGTAVPTLAFTGGGGSGAAATVICDLVATGITVVGTGNATLGNAAGFIVITDGGKTAGTAVAGATNPAISTDYVKVRTANFSGVTTAGGNITATGLVTNDAGQFQAVPNGYVISGVGGNVTIQQPSVTITVGSITDTSFIQPI
jgi:hypothetical protein